MGKIHLLLIIVASALFTTMAYAVEPAYPAAPLGGAEMAPVPEPPPMRCYDRISEMGRKACCQETYTISPADDGNHMNAVECCLAGYETPEGLSCCTEVSKHQKDALTACPK